ncbi:FAD-dependent monooxygenase [Paraburkholderia sediminicola]|uniref:FAD-dependent monooxygenase n=1 Tax=Paraburkholderia sediminicola TaxID=458836 RepID=UPI0038BACBC1
MEGKTFGGMSPESTEVLVVGAGPVGATLAGDLGLRGIRCVVIDETDGVVKDPRLHAVNIRTMELARRWGIVDDLRNCGWPATHSQDVAYVTKVGGAELGRIAWPSISEMRPPPQSPVFAQRCPQNWFNPILHRFAANQTSVSVRFRHRLLSFEQADDHVIAVVVDLESGRQYTINAKFMVACEGARSATREALGIQRERSPQIGFAADLVFRSPALARKTGANEAGRYTMITPEGMSFSLLPMDGRELYRMMLYAEPDKTTTERAIAAIRQSIGTDVPFDVVNDVLHWVPRVTMAERFRADCVFIAGDAAHTMPTAGGYGMNTGILDAADLGWKLAAVLRGWGGPTLLDSYEAERRPAAQRTSAMASSVYKQFHVMGDVIKGYGSTLLDTSAQGDIARKEIGGKLMSFFSREFNSLGGALGYRYEGSPVCIQDGSTPPEDTMTEYVQTSRPGHRAPHVWIRDGVSTLDLFRNGFTIIRCGGDDKDCAALREAAKERNVPLDVVDFHDDKLRELYPRHFTLIRPDGHVAWRGDTLDRPAHTIWDIVTGQPVGAGQG